MIYHHTDRLFNLIINICIILLKYCVLYLKMLNKISHNYKWRKNSMAQSYLMNKQMGFNVWRDRDHTNPKLSNNINKVYPWGKCQRSCLTKDIFCENCHTWFHSMCENLDSPSFDKLSELDFWWWGSVWFWKLKNRIFEHGCSEMAMKWQLQLIENLCCRLICQLT